MADLTQEVHSIIRQANTLADQSTDPQGTRRFLLATAYAEIANRDGLDMRDAAAELHYYFAEVLNAGGIQKAGELH